MSTSWLKLEVLFDDLVNNSEQRQQEQLDLIAKENPELASQLRELLAHANQSIGFNPSPEHLLSDDELRTDSVLGNYRIVQKIGQGGMGTVYLAVRTEDFDQQVAIKLGRQSLDPGSSLRFMRERQILADLNHPHISRLLDGGTSDTGQPYLVMEYVAGESIDAYCRNHEVRLHELLSMFQKICIAVSFAHQNLIIHQDIKPGNILVTANGEPRLLDFGIVKVIEQESNELPAQSLAMTPQYVSPEQLLGKATTTLTDVYALGLLLYELLTGQRAQPVSRENLTELHEIVIHREPEAISSVIAKLDLNSYPAAKDFTQQVRSWQRDLYNIVKRALAKKPEYRYASVAALSEDLERLMAGNPVEASGDTLLYRLRKLAGKYRYRFAALSVAVLSLLTLVIGLSWSIIVANQARDDANRRLNQSQDLISYMLGDLRQQLEPKVRLEILDGVGEKAMAFFASLDPIDQSDESLAQMALALRQIGDVRLSQGKFELGRSAFRESLILTQALYDRDVANNQRLFDLGQSHFWVGYASLRQGALDATRESFADYLKVSQDLVSHDPANLNWLLELSYAHNNLGTVQLRLGNAEQARKRFEHSRRIKQTLLDTKPNQLDWQIDHADTLGWLADAEHRLGNLNASLQLRNLRHQQIATLYVDHPDNLRINRALAYAKLTLGRQLVTVGRIAAARQAITESISLADQRVEFDPANKTWREDAARSRLDLVDVLTISGETKAAAKLLDEAQLLAEPLVSQDDTSSAWQLDLHAQSMYQQALLLYLRSELIAAEAQIVNTLELLDALRTDLQGDLALIELAQRSILLAGDIAHTLCRPDEANRLWKSYSKAADEPVETMSFMTPFHLAWQSAIWNRIGQTMSGEAGQQQLTKMKYANPWYLMFIHSPAPARDCRISMN